MSPTNVRKPAPPMSAPTARPSVRSSSRPLPERINAARSAAPTMLTRETRKVTTPNTRALEMSAGTRLGTAVRVERIIPVPYSPVMTSAPRTATTNWLKAMPMVAACIQ